MCKSECEYAEFIKCLVLILDLVLCREHLDYFFRESNFFFSFPSQNKNRKRETIKTIVKFKPYEIDAR